MVMSNKSFSFKKGRKPSQTAFLALLQMVWLGKSVCFVFSEQYEKLFLLKQPNGKLWFKHIPLWGHRGGIFF